MNTVREMVNFMVKDFYTGNEYLQAKYYVRGKSLTKEVVQKTFDAYRQARTSEEKRIILRQVRLAK